MREHFKIGNPKTSVNSVKVFLRYFAIGNATDLDNIVRTFDSYDGTNVKISDLLQNLLKSSTGRSVTKPTSGADALIPNFSKMSPRTKTNSAVHYIKNQFNAKNLKPTAAYRMAD
jgi:hypothetical protein